MSAACARRAWVSYARTGRSLRVGSWRWRVGVRTRTHVLEREQQCDARRQRRVGESAEDGRALERAAKRLVETRLFRGHRVEGPARVLSAALSLVGVTAL
jgi:hypothetical protein